MNAAGQTASSGQTPAPPGLAALPELPVIPPASPPLRLGSKTVGAQAPAVMAIVNRTTDSFYAPARHENFDQALAAVEAAIRDGAEIVDIGGVRAGTGPEVSVGQEIDRVADLVTAVRAAFPHIAISVDTWRAPVAEAVIQCGADLINDTWAGADPQLAQVAGRAGVGLVISHTGGLPPRRDPVRVHYPLPAQAPQGTAPRDAVVFDVVAALKAGAERAISHGVPPESVLIDPTHDFGKRTIDSLALVARAGTLASLGFPLLMALSRKDFVGETLDLAPGERLSGTLAATAIAAWMGARVFRAHDVKATRQVLEMTAAIRGELAPRAPVRGLELR